MKEKIAEAVKTKLAKLGFGREVLDGVTSYIEKTITEESQIEEAVIAIEPFLKGLQTETDRVRTELSTMKAKFETLETEYNKLKSDKTGDDSPPDFTQKIEELLAEKLSPIQNELAAYKAKEVREAHSAMVARKVKEIGIPDWRAKQGFTISDSATEEEVSKYLADIQKDLVAAGLGGKQSFPIGGNSQATKEEVDQIVSGMKI